MVTPLFYQFIISPIFYKPTTEKSYFVGLTKLKLMVRIERMFNRSNIPIRTFSNNEALVKERRDYIALCSTKLFTKKGYEKTNMREVAKACELSIGSLYHYFGSKEEILYYLIDNATKEQLKYLKTCAHNLEDDTSISALKQLITKYFKWHDDNQDITLFVYQVTKNLPKPAQQNIINNEILIHDIFKSCLRKVIESGTFHTDDPNLVAHNIMVFAHTWALRRWYTRKHWTLQTYTSGQIDLIIRMIKDM